MCVVLRLSLPALWCMSSAPVLARVEAKEAVLRWYPGEHGAHKYVLLQKFVEGLDNVDRLRATAGGGATSTSSSEEDWAVAYEGQVRARQATEMRVVQGWPTNNRAPA